MKKKCCHFKKLFFQSKSLKNCNDWKIRSQLIKKCLNINFTDVVLLLQSIFCGVFIHDRLQVQVCLTLVIWVVIWVMVIVGGTGNNFGAILGGFAVWFLWVQAAPISLFLISLFTSHLPETNELKIHLINSAPYFRFLIIGIGLLVIMRYRPQGILPEKIVKQ